MKVDIETIVSAVPNFSGDENPRKYVVIKFEEDLKPADQLLFDVGDKVKITMEKIEEDSL